MDFMEYYVITYNLEGNDQQHSFRLFKRKRFVFSFSGGAEMWPVVPVPISTLRQGETFCLVTDHALNLFFFSRENKVRLMAADALDVYGGVWQRRYHDQDMVVKNITNCREFEIYTSDADSRFRLILNGEIKREFYFQRMNGASPNSMIDDEYNLIAMDNEGFLPHQQD